MLNTCSTDPIFPLVDTGSAVSLINDQVLKSTKVIPAAVGVQSLTGNCIQISGACELTLKKGENALET